MGQTQGRKIEVDDTIEVKRYGSRGGCGQSEASEAIDRDTSRNNTNLGVFTRLKKSLHEKAPSSKTPETGGSDDSMESISFVKLMKGSEQTLDHAVKGEAEEESRGDEGLPILMSPQENDEKVERYSSIAKICSSGEKNDTDGTTVVSVSKSAIGESEDNGGDLEMGESEKSPGSNADLLEERYSLEEQLRKLETPLKWFQPFISKAALPSSGFSDASSDSVGGWRAKRSQDHFRVSTHHLWLSAKYCLVDGDPQKALKELTMSKRAKVRFLDAAIRQASSENVEKLSSEGQKGDEDVDRALNLVIGGTTAAISFKLKQFGDTVCVLKSVMKQSTSLGVRAAVKGIEASVLACVHSCLPSALDAAREAVAMAPDYWRWHALLGSLLYHPLEIKDPRGEREKRREMLDALESVCSLEPANVIRLLHLADSYRDVAFQVRKTQDHDEDFKDYAMKAIKTYMLAVDREPRCIRSHVSAARSLWNLRRLRPEATQKAISIAERAFRILTADAERDEHGMDDSRGNATLEVQAESALALGLVWELIGNMDKARCLFRMAATNPLAPINIAYRAELGIIVSNFKRGKLGKCKTDSMANVDIMCLLDNLLAKFSDSDFQQQTLCHRGHYLMAIMKDNSAALENLCEAVNIRRESPFIKRYYPRFSSDGTHYPLRVSDLIHELACKELARVQVRASKGSPEAMRRSHLLNEQIELAQNISRAEYKGAREEGERRTGSNGSGDASPPADVHSPIAEKQGVGQENDSPDASLGLEVDSSTENHHVENSVIENANGGGVVAENDLAVNTVIENQELANSVVNDQIISTIENQVVQHGEVDCDVTEEAEAISVPETGVGGMSVSDRLILMFRETTI